MAIVSEPYRTRGKNEWMTDLSNKAAVWACGSIYRGLCLICIINIYSVYISPNVPIDEFSKVIDNLVRDAKEHSPMVIAGDFNAWAVDWGCHRTNERGRALLEAFTQLDVVLANKGNVHTFRRAGYGSIVDLTFVTSSLASSLEWNVSEHYTHSDHQAIIFSVGVGKHRRAEKYRKRPFSGWAKDKLDKEAFVEVFSNQRITESKPDSVLEALKSACDASMPRR